LRPQHTERLRRLQTLLKDRVLSAALLTDPSTITYLSGFISIIHTPVHVPTVTAVVPAVGDATFLVQESELSLLPPLPYPARVAPYGTPGERRAAVVSALEVASTGHALGVERRRMPTVLMDEIEGMAAHRWDLVDISQATVELRECKDPWEQAQAGKAAGLVRHAFEVARNALAPGAYELAIKALMERECMAKAVAMCPGDTVQTQFNVVCRERLEELHGLARAAAAPETGTGFVLSNVRVNGYWADLARTVLIGPADPELRSASEAAARAQLQALGLIAPGATIRSVVARMEEMVRIEGHGLQRRFRAIRGLGLETAESPDEDEPQGVFRSGQLLCLQCYLAGRRGIVGRSDTILVTESGAQCLTAEAG